MEICAASHPEIYFFLFATFNAEKNIYLYYETKSHFLDACLLIYIINKKNYNLLLILPYYQIADVIYIFGNSFLNTLLYVYFNNSMLSISEILFSIAIM